MLTLGCRRDRYRDRDDAGPRDISVLLALHQGQPDEEFEVELTEIFDRHQKDPGRSRIALFKVGSRARIFHFMTVETSSRWGISNGML